MDVLIVTGPEHTEPLRNALRRHGATVERAPAGSALTRAEAATLVLVPLSLSDPSPLALLTRLERDTDARAVALFDGDDPEMLNRVECPVVSLAGTDADTVAERLADLVADARLTDQRERTSAFDDAVAEARARASAPTACDAGETDAESEAATIRAVCETLVRAPPVTAAWLAVYDAEADALVPATAAGIDAGLLATTDPLDGADVRLEDGALRVPIPRGAPPHDVLALAVEGSVDDHTRERLAALGEALATASRGDDVETFSRVLSHELRNHLQAVESYLDLLDADDEDRLARVRDALGRISRLADLASVVAASEVAADSLSTCDLRESAGDAWASISAPASLTVPETVSLRASESLLVALLENLCRNAVKHGDADEIRVAPLPDEAGFYVADDGTGIPQAQHRRVFEFGYTTAEDGSGVGLALVERIANAHGWSVTLSESERGGARFEFRGVDTV